MHRTVAAIGPTRVDVFARPRRRPIYERTVIDRTLSLSEMPGDQCVTSKTFAMATNRHGPGPCARVVVSPY